VPICANVTLSGERSTLKPVWLMALLVHARLICVAEAAVAVNREGAAGGPVVMAVAVLEGKL